MTEENTPVSTIVTVKSRELLVNMYVSSDGEFYHYSRRPDPGETPETYVPRFELTMPGEVFIELSRPETITVTVEPGDLLNVDSTASSTIDRVDTV